MSGVTVRTVVLSRGVSARLSHGHTEGLLVPLVDARDDGPPLAFPTDPDAEVAWAEGLPDGSVAFRTGDLIGRPGA